MLDFLICLDRSGSMQDCKADHEGGLRSFVEDQRKLDDDEMRLTYIQFDTTDPCDIVLDRVPLADVPPDKLTLVPRSGTPLLDGIGKAVAHLRDRHHLTAADNVVVTIITDGEENSSKEWTKPRVRQLIEELEKGAWKFLFLGANFDAFTEGAALGMAAGAMMNFQPTGQAVRASYNALNANVDVLRKSGGTKGQMTNSGKALLNWTAAQQAAAMPTADDDLTAGDPQFNFGNAVEDKGQK